MREVYDVRVPEAQRGSGLGSALMASICAEADTSGVHLMLIADTPELADWYRRLGFEEIQHEPAIVMTRKARNG
jgi:N-acetylglutamate synthase-like GNAT family acetyltransferase